MKSSTPLENATELIEKCLVPNSLIDLSISPLEANFFKGFKKSLAFNLESLFDVIACNEELLSDTGENTLKFRINFILLLCEQLAENTVFQTNNPALIKNFERLTERYFNSFMKQDAQFVSSLFDIYKQKLKKDEWKHFVGPIFGFSKFCTLLFQTSESEFMNTDRCMFILSVGTLLIDNYEPTFKQIGIKFFNLLLDKTPVEIIKQINIHEVIYSNVFPNIQKINEEQINLDLWNCLYKCICFYNIEDFSKWNKVDDLMEALIQKIVFESKDNLTMHFMYFICKLSSLPIRNSEIIMKLTNFNIVQELIQSETFMYSEIREFMKNYESFITYRWVKKLLKLYINETQKLFGDKFYILSYLHVLHMSYLLSVFSVPPLMIQSHLLDYIKYIIPVFMEILSQNSEDILIIKRIHGFIDTILLHISGIPNGTVDDSNTDEFSNYKKALITVSKHRIFAVV